MCEILPIALFLLRRVSSVEVPIVRKGKTFFGNVLPVLTWQAKLQTLN